MLPCSVSFAKVVAMIKVKRVALIICLCLCSACARVIVISLPTVFILLQGGQDQYLTNQIINNLLL